MSAPKSVTKIKKGENGSYIEFTSNVDRTQYYLFELSRRALQDIGRLFVRRFYEELSKHFNLRSGKKSKYLSYTAYSNKNTTHPHLVVGLKSSKKAKAIHYWAYFQEFGAADGRIKRLGLLNKIAHESYMDIRKIEAQYLSGIDLNAPMQDETDYEGENDAD